MKLGMLGLMARVRHIPAVAWIARLVPGSLKRQLARKRKDWLTAAVSFPSLPPASPSESEFLRGSTSNTGSQFDSGANVFAFMRGQFGLGESARRYVEALLRSKIPLTLHDVSLQIPHGQNERQFEAQLGEAARFPIDLVFVNPDLFEDAMAKIAALRSTPIRRYIIAVWFWELERIPDAWQTAIGRVDEILVASEFVEKAFRRATDKPVTRVPLPLGPHPDSGAVRSDFGLETESFIFLTTFDFNSSVYRKNPVDVITAFQKAFGRDRNDISLLIKTSNGHRHEERLVELLKLVGDDPRIVIRDGILDRDHIGALQRCCDAYVSLHRAEGFGLGMAESMAIGKPVIATGWSGNLEFMTAENSWLVDYELVSVPSGAYRFAEGQRWAQPCIEQASRFMREVVDDGVLRESRSRRAMSDIATRLSQHAAATMIQRRLDTVTASMRSSISVPSGVRPTVSPGASD